MTQEFVLALSDSWNAGIVVQTLTIGGFIALIAVMGGTRAIAEKLSKSARSAASAQIYTWLMGIFIFFPSNFFSSFKLNFIRYQII